MPDSNPLQAGQRFGNGRFVLVRALGRGGMGEVWLAQDERLHEDVALKFLPPEIRGDPVALDDLRRETARSHKLTHPNIVRIHDLHEEPDGTAFIIMEYVDGPTLAWLRLEQPGRVFAWDYLKPLVEQLCAALDYAHGEKVIHRDLKPANMMVDSRGRLKLADFGIAATASDSMSRVSAQQTTSGTLLYMSPQQLAGKRAQVTDDIYALGATLYELLTSQPPFVSGDITHQILHEMPEPIAERLAALEIENDVPGDVSAMIMACLAKEREQRPQSAAAVAGWIGMEIVKKPSTEAFFQSTQEVEAVPEPPVGKTRLWVAGILAALALLVTGIFFLAKHNSAKRSGPALPTVWLPLNIADACNADIITTAERKSSDALTFNGGNLASSSWLQKSGYAKRGIPDDGRVAVPEAAAGNFFQLEMPPNKNAILISGPNGSHPEPVTVELAAGDRRHYSEISVLHFTEWCGSGLLRVALGYETGAETTAWLEIFDAASTARPVPLPSEVTVAAVTIDVRIRQLNQPADLLAQRIPVDSQRILHSITFSFESLLSPPRNVADQTSRQRAITAIFAISVFPAPGHSTEMNP